MTERERASSDIVERLATIKTMDELNLMRFDVVQAMTKGGAQTFDELQGAFQQAKERLQRPDWQYNAEKPDECRRAAANMVGSAAALCASAMGALVDEDNPDTYKARQTLLKFRAKLNALRFTLKGGVYHD
jgi:hypothetical protein